VQKRESTQRKKREIHCQIRADKGEGKGSWMDGLSAFSPLSHVSLLNGEGLTRYVFQAPIQKWKEEKN